MIDKTRPDAQNGFLPMIACHRAQSSGVEVCFVIELVALPALESKTRM
jgi:hypothetical protein